MNLAIKQHQYWNDLDHPSMPDKHLVSLEVQAIKKLLGSGNLLDVGCGEGENTGKFSQIKGLKITGVDFAQNRIKLARQKCPKVKFIQADLTKKLNLDKFNYIVSQRFLINLPNWSQQQKVIKNLIKCLKPKGKLILCEGSLQGVDSLNKLRKKFKLEPIPIRWHNIFIDDKNLVKEGFKLMDAFGGYFLFTRVARPCFDKDLNWNNSFNKNASKVSLPLDCSRQKVWLYINH